MLETAGQAGPMKLDITYPVNDFTRFAKTWDGWDEQMMGIVVRYIKTQGPLILHSARTRLMRRRAGRPSRTTSSTASQDPLQRRQLQRASNGQRPARCVAVALSGPASPRTPR